VSGCYTCHTAESVLAVLCFSDNPKKPPRKEKRSSGNTSWYAECGLFDQTEVQNIGITGVFMFLIFYY
jgi:hypothetical protein